MSSGGLILTQGSGGVWTGLVMCWPCADNHSCCELMGAVVLPQPGDTISLQSSLTFGSCKLSGPSSMMVPEPLEWVPLNVPFGSEPSTDPDSLDFDQIPPHVLRETQTGRPLVRDPNQPMKSAWTLTERIPLLKQPLIFSPLLAPERTSLLLPLYQ